MGTSSSNYGPKGGIPLLPDWNDNENNKNPGKRNDDNFDRSDNLDNSDNDDKGKENQNKPDTNSPLTGVWSGAKRTLGVFSQSPTKSNFNRAAKSYVRASGGAKNISLSARHGKRVAGHFITFLNDVRNDGINKTYQKLGFGEISGDSVDQVFNNLADILSSSGGTDEETIARSAVIEALAKIYEDFGFQMNPIDSFDKLSKEQANTYIEYYITSYIYERWIHELGIKIEEKDISSANAVKAEKLAYDFIQSSVNLKFDNIDLSSFNYGSNAGKAKIDEIFTQSYLIIEAL